MVTTTAALQKGMVSLDDEFEIINGVNVGGRFINNANGEYCGGTFREAFAESCNADFAPLGPKIGNDALVVHRRTVRLQLAAHPLRAADHPRRQPPRPTIPTEIGDELDLGVCAIGQGEVLATPLEMASVAQTIGNRGVREPTSIVANQKLRPHAKPVRVMSKKIAGELTELMVGVVNERHGNGRRDPPGPGRRQDRHRRAGTEPGQENAQTRSRSRTPGSPPSPRPSAKLAIGVLLIERRSRGRRSRRAGGGAGSLDRPLSQPARCGRQRRPTGRG